MTPRNNEMEQQNNTTTTTNDNDDDDDDENDVLLEQQKKHHHHHHHQQHSNSKNASPLRKKSSPVRHHHHHRRSHHHHSKNEKEKHSSKSPHKNKHHRVTFEKHHHHQQQQQQHDDEDEEEEEEGKNRSNTTKSSFPPTTTTTQQQSNNTTTNNNKNNNKAILITTKETGSLWELTWPIWHMLPRHERKAIALSYGMKSIGEFEEYMTLEKAVGETEEEEENRNENSSSAAAAVVAVAANNAAAPYDNEVLYQEELRPKNYGLGTVAYQTHKNDDGKNHDDDDDDDDDDESSSDEEEEDEITTTNTNTNTTDTIIMTNNNNNNHDPFLLLPEEILTLHIFPYLPIDAYSTLSLVSPSWKSFTRTESVYKMLCQRCYLQQSKKKALHVHRFGGSYRQMLYDRPRVKTGGGVYVLKYAEVVKIQRDMWTEIPVGAVLENVYYRYMYFHENSRVLYALTHISPHEMIPKLHRMKITNEEKAKSSTVVWGHYEVKGCNVTVWASHPWHDVKMEMKLIPEGVDGARGRFCAMTLEKHLSSASGNFDEYYSMDLVEYKVPNEYFRFLRDWRL